MPIYEYKCKDCGSHVEKRQSVSETPVLICEKCGGKLEKQWSLSGFQFKGEGWYVTDYAGKKAGPTDKPSGEKSEKNSSGDSTPKAEPASNPVGESKTSSKEIVSKPSTE